MPQHYRPTALTLASLVFLLPLFFIPGGTLDLGNAKALLFCLGTLIAGLLFLVHTWKHKEFSLPKHHLLVTALLLPIVYLLSGFLSTPSSLSLLGYNLEAGTFGYILLGVILLLLSSVVFSNVPYALQVTLALFASLSVLSIFAVVKILTKGNWLVFGNFSGNMGNPLGNWTDLAIVSGLLALLVILAVGMLPMKRYFKAVLYAVFLLATTLMAVIGFSTAFALVLVGSVLILIYFFKMENDFHFQSGTHAKNIFSKPVFLPIVLALVSLVFFINPNISQTRGSLGQVVSGYFGVSNSEVHPTLSTTLSISKAVLSQSALLGSGPNTFGQDWLIHKPTDINTTPFWSTNFPFGAGFIPTQVASTGIVGSFLWLGFFVLLIALGFRILSNIPESRGPRFILVSALLVSIFIWTASFLYMPSDATLLIAFVFTGVLLAMSSSLGIISSRVYKFAQSPLRSFALVLILLAMIGSVLLGWTELKKVLGAFHFRQAVTLSAVSGTSFDSIASELNKAVAFAPIDLYFQAISQLNFSKAQVVANSATGTPEKNRELFEDALGKSVQAARAAVTANPESFNNWVTLGTIYSALVGDPLKVEGAYESAQFAYNEAFKRNPNNPALPLLLARLENSKGNIDQARSYARSSIALKENYADAYLLLAQIEIRANNIPAAINSAEKLAALSPGNEGILFELGVLKYSALDYRGAAQALEEALKVNQKYANAKYYLALSFTKLGQKEEAKKLLEELLLGNPDVPELQAALKEASKK